MTMDFAGETRSDARMASEGPRATGTSRPGGLSYGIASKYETPSVKLRHVEGQALNLRFDAAIRSWRG